MTADIELLPLPERFDCTNGNTPWCQGCYTMTPNEYGDYVQWEDYERITAAKAAEIERLRAEVEKLRELCGCAYQMAGYHDAPVEWLDALGDAGDGTPLDEWRVQAKDLSDVLLPYQPDNNSHEDAEIEALRAEVEEAREGWHMANGTADLAMKHRDAAEAQAERLAEALRIAEAALEDIGDADREPGDDVAWCERRARLGLRRVRDTLRDHDQEVGNG